MKDVKFAVSPQRVNTMMRLFAREQGIKTLDYYKGNFNRQGFSNNVFIPWAARKDATGGRKFGQSKNGKFTAQGRALLMRTGTLKRGWKQSTSNMTIIFYNSVSYSKIHNEGGRLPGGRPYIPMGKKGIVFLKKSTASSRESAGKKVRYTKPGIMPKREQVGSSQELFRQIDKDFHKFMRGVFK